MATPSQVKTGMDDIANVISAQRAVMEKVKSNAALASATLDTLATNYADVVATVQGYDGGDAFEAQAKAELDKLTTEFLALKAHADAVAATDLDI